MLSKRLSVDLVKLALVTKNGNSSEYGETFTRFFYRFANKSTIPGLSKLADRESYKYQRIAFLLPNIETVINSTRYPVYQITFPVVSICNRNQLNWQRLEAAKSMFLPQENNTEISELFELIITAYNTFQFDQIQVFQIFENRPIHALTHINFSLVYEYMSWSCEELLTECKWRNNDINCCDYFFQRHSQIGC
uniref:Uncharacterized protein n=1 Tax=Glossina palpalis gambiensis TaxID=67801 RepID=A0A1B0C2T0_9MUSC